jgi:hypothetical protein
MTTVNFLGLTGVAGETKMVLGDSGLPEDASLGMYGSLTKDPLTKAQEKIQVLRAAAGAAEQGPVGGGGMYNPLNNRPMNR